MFSPKTLKDRLDYIQGRIEKASARSGRKFKDITLVGITKSFPKKIWDLALNVNLTTLGESRIQETIEKEKTFRKRDKIELHFIGHLQSNKVRKAIELFDIIQTVDSIKLAGRINSICKESHIRQHIYLQVNTGEDPNKHGIPVKKANSIAREISKMENLILEGIMTIPPNEIDIKKLSLLYKKTRKIRDEIHSKINKNCKNLSMGMSNDYEIAIEEGATHIRIGSGLFGERPI